MPPNYAIVRFYREFSELFHEKYGFDSYIVERLPAELEKLGFVNI